jgi:hypothetical protein
MSRFSSDNSFPGSYFNAGGAMPESHLAVINSCVHMAIVDVNHMRKEKIATDCVDEIMLYGNQGIFDSMGLVRFLMTVEEIFREQHGIELQLMSEKAMSRTTSPFSSIKTLKKFIAEEIIEIEV